MKYRFMITHRETTLAFSNDEETLQRILNVLELPDAKIVSARDGRKRIVMAGALTPVEVGATNDQPR